MKGVLAKKGIGARRKVTRGPAQPSETANLRTKSCTERGCALQELERPVG